MTARFPPSRAEGLARLAAAIPRLGADYAAGRNTDPGPTPPGPDRPGAGSALSPYIRHRLLLEQEVVVAALAAHGPNAAGAFIRQVFWRTYWKGWMEARPAVWTAYRESVRRGRDRLATEAGLRRQFHAATQGDTGIACFDAWARALVADNWLHNHARMWFASIWIFTLRLPWALGADFFARHLLDGDPASNTLSWRWVAGLHTPGKHYLARAENIRRFTEGRFDPRGDLDEAAEPLSEPIPPPPAMPPPPDPAPRGDVALLLHIDDLLAERLPDLAGLRMRSVAALAPPAASAAHGTAEPVRAFREAALADAAARAAAHYRLDIARIDAESLPAWAMAAGHPLVSLQAPVGPVAECLHNSGVRVVSVRRPWDALAWPHCRRGYFQFAKELPDLVRSLGI